MYQSVVLDDRCIVLKSHQSSNLGVMAPSLGCTPKNVAFGYEDGENQRRLSS